MENNNFDQKYHYVFRFKDSELGELKAEDMIAEDFIAKVKRIQENGIDIEVPKTDFHTGYILLKRVVTSNKNAYDWIKKAGDFDCKTYDVVLTKLDQNENVVERWEITSGLPVWTQSVEYDSIEKLLKVEQLQIVHLGRESIEFNLN